MKLGCLVPAVLICQEVPSGVIFREAGEETRCRTGIEGADMAAGRRILFISRILLA